MKRGRSQVLWRYMPGALFRYNESGGWSKTIDVTLKNAGPLSGALTLALRHALVRWNAIGPTGFPDPAVHPGKYVVGEPLNVMYELWPLVFTCRSCGKVHYFKDVANLRAVNDRLRCFKCKENGQLRQIPYAFVHECGRIDTLFVPKCDVNPSHDIELVNKGGFQESYWKCQTCNKALRRGSRDGLGIRHCECGKKRLKRGVPLEDSRTYYSQTVTIVEVHPSLIEEWHAHPRFGDLLLAGTLGLSCYEPRHLLTLATRKPGSSELTPELIATRDLLVQGGMPASDADAIVQKGARSVADPWAAYETALTPYQSLRGSQDWAQARASSEFLFVRDEPSAAAISLQELSTEMRSSGDLISAERYESELRLAKDLGFCRTVSCSSPSRALGRHRLYALLQRA